jgi:hypothetical protein
VRREASSRGRQLAEAWRAALRARHCPAMMMMMMMIKKNKKKKNKTQHCFERRVTCHLPAIAAVSLQPHPAPNAAAAGGVSDSCTSHAHASRISARTDRGSLRIFTTREEEVDT